MELDINELSMGMKTGDIEVIILRRTEKQLFIENVASFTGESDANDIAKQIVIGFTKYFQNIFPPGKMDHIGSFINHYLDLIKRPVLK